MRKNHIISFCLLVVYVFSFWSTVYADNVTVDDEGYNFSICLHKAGPSQKAQTWKKDYYWFFDLDHSIVVYCYKAKKNYGSGEKYKFTAYKMEEESDGLYHLYDVNGAEYDWCFKVITKKQLFGLLESKFITPYDHNGKSSDYWTYAVTMENPPTYELRPAGFYKKYPKPADVYREFSATDQLNTKDEEKMVWITEAGRYWHTIPNCGNIRNASEITIEKAKAFGYIPCSECS